MHWTGTHGEIGRPEGAAATAVAEALHKSQIQEFSAAENIELKSVLLNPAAPPEASTGLHRQQG